MEESGMQMKETINHKAVFRVLWVFRVLGAGCLAGAMLLSCGGGSGIGPEEILKREEQLKEQLPINWTQYNAGDLDASIEFFTATLSEADALEGVEAVKNEVKSEAQNGIGWTFMTMHDLEAAERAFNISTSLNRRNADAWVGRAGVALAQGNFGDVVQYSIDGLEAEPGYKSASRLDSKGRDLGHDNVDVRHVRLMLSEAYFHLGRYSATDRADPNNSAAQLRLVNRNYRFSNPGQLLDSLSVAAVTVQETVTSGL